MPAPLPYRVKQFIDQGHAQGRTMNDAVDVLTNEITTLLTLAGVYAREIQRLEYRVARLERAARA